MKVIKQKLRQCSCCMETHVVQEVEVKENQLYKGVIIYYTATYMYCDNDDTYYANEAQMTKNHKALQAGYKKFQDELKNRRN